MKILVYGINYSPELTGIGKYTGEMVETEITNRLISIDSARTRVLGLQLWYYGAKGFLHWGYNYCYDYMSGGFFTIHRFFCPPTAKKYNFVIHFVKKLLLL